MRYFKAENGDLYQSMNRLQGYTEITKERYIAELQFIQENAVHIVDDFFVEEDNLTLEEQAFTDEYIAGVNEVDK